MNIRLVLAAIAQWFLSSLALAQTAIPPNPETTQACPGLVARDQAPVIRAAWHPGAPNRGGSNSGAYTAAALNSDQVRLTFLGHSTTTERYGNSIFIFEIANLCIAHLGHLHHTLTQQQLNEIGRIDVVMAPVDGSYTLDLDGMMEVLTAIKAPLIVPMHYYGQYILDRFLDRARKLWDVETADIPSVVVSKAILPAAPKVLVLPEQF